jgi:hypothetical protein
MLNHAPTLKQTKLTNKQTDRQTETEEKVVADERKIKNRRIMREDWQVFLHCCERKINEATYKQSYKGKRDREKQVTYRVTDTPLRER